MYYLSDVADSSIICLRHYNNRYKKGAFFEHGGWYFFVFKNLGYLYKEESSSLDLTRLYQKLLPS